MTTFNVSIDTQGYGKVSLYGQNDFCSVITFKGGFSVQSLRADSNRMFLSWPEDGKAALTAATAALDEFIANRGSRLLTEASRHMKKRIETITKKAPESAGAVQWNPWKLRYGTWVDVDDRLPDSPEMVIIATESGTVSASAVLKNDWNEHPAAPDDVIAWMPMPESVSTGGKGWKLIKNERPSSDGHYLIETTDGFMCDMAHENGEWVLWDGFDKEIAAWRRFPLPCIF